MPSVWLLLIPDVFLSSPVHSPAPPPHAFDCLHGRTCHSFLENVQGSGVEWQRVRLPCGRTGWDPGGFAIDPALPFSIKHAWCLGWVTLSFCGELGLTCAWKMASLMGRTTFRKNSLRNQEWFSAVLWKHYPNAFSLSHLKSLLFVQAALRHYWKKGARTTDSLWFEPEFAGSVTYYVIVWGNFQFPYFIKGGLVVILVVVVIIITYCIFTISQLLC